jgi:tryptophan-rich sensory protein
MVSESIIVLLAITAGIAGGIWSPLLGWLASNEKFSIRKFLQGFMTCLSSSFVFSLIALENPPQDGIVNLAIFWLTIFLATIGVDYARNKIGGMTRQTGQG